MASDKFGSNPVAPLYNATGRNPRDVEMGTPGKALGSVGSSGAGGKDFGIPNQPTKSADLGASMFSPFNPYNMRYGRPGSGGGGGGDEGYDVDAMERIAKAQTPQTVNFAAQAGRNVVQDSQYSEDGDNYKDIQQKIETTPGASPAKPPRTPEQIQASKDKGQATRTASKAANPTGHGKRNPNRPEKTQSPIARKPRAASAKPRATATQSVGKVTQTMGNF